MTLAARGVDGRFAYGRGVAPVERSEKRRSCEYCGGLSADGPSLEPRPGQPDNRKASRLSPNSGGWPNACRTSTSLTKLALWLQTSHPQLDGERPYDLINDGRIAAVLEVIDRLESGVYL